MFVITLDYDNPSPDEGWAPKPTTALEIAKFIEDCLELGGPDVQVTNHFEQT